MKIHIEGRSISEIAETMGCSENTVKSRLNYGRKNIKEKAEALQKKGYKLYGLAPIPLVIYLLRIQNEMLISSGYIDTTAANVITKIRGENVAYNGETMQESNYSYDGQARNNISYDGKSMRINSVRHQATYTVGKTVAKKTIAHGLTTKIIAGVASTALIGGTVTGVVYNNSLDNKKQQIVTTAQEANNLAVGASEQAIETTEPVVEETTEPYVEVANNEFSKLLQGGVTKEQLKFILAYAPAIMTQSGPTDQQLDNMCVYMASGIGGYEDKLLDRETDYNANAIYKLKDINNMFSVITDKKFARGNSEIVKVKGNTATIVMATPTDLKKTKILSAKYTSKEMRIEYKVTTKINHYEEEPYVETKSEKRIAILKKQASGKYKIVEIKPKKKLKKWAYAYAKIVNEAMDKTYYSVGDMVIENSECRYRLCDVDGNSVPELVISAIDSRSARYDFYSYDDEKGAYSVGSLHNGMRSYIARQKSDGKYLLYIAEAYSPKVRYAKIILKNGKVKYGKFKEDKKIDLAEGTKNDNVVTVESALTTDLSLLTE